MSTRDDGGVAFPQPPAIGPAGDEYWPGDYGRGGMTLRDWFAGMAAAPLMLHCIEHIDLPPDAVAKAAAKAAYGLADAMLAERAK